MGSIGTLWVNLSANTKEFRKKMSQAERTMRRSGQKMKRVGKDLTLGLSLPLIGVGAAAFKAASDFESAFAGVEKTVEGTVEQLDMLRQGILDMSKDIPASTTEIARVAEAAGQLGIATDDILSFTETMIGLGVATNLSSDEAATALARLANITKMPQDQFDRLGSTVVALGNNLATTEAEIVEMGLRLSGAGSTIGLTESQILSFAGALSSLGIKAEAGGSAFSKVMLDMAKAVAMGGGNLELFASGAGQSVESFANLFREDAAGAVVAFVEGLGQLDDKTLFTTLDDLKLSGIRVRDTLLRTSGAVDLVKESLALGAKAWEENSALNEETAKRYATTESQLKILKNQMNAIAITLGKALIPAVMSFLEAIQPLLDGIGKMAEGFANLHPVAQRIIIGFAALLAAIGPVVWAIGQAKLVIAVLIPIIAKLGPVLAKLPAIITAVKAAFMLLGWAGTGVIGLVILGITGVILAWKNWDKITAFVKKVYTAAKEWLQEKLLAVFDKVGEGVEKVKGFFKDMWKKVVGESYVPDMVRGIGEWMKKLDDNMVRPVERFTDAVANSFADMALGVETSFTDMVNSIIRDMLRLGIRNALGDIFSSFSRNPVASINDGIVAPIGGGGVGNAFTAGRGGGVKVIVNNTNGSAIDVKGKGTAQDPIEIVVGAVKEAAGIGALDGMMAANWNVHRQAVGR